MNKHLKHSCALITCLAFGMPWSEAAQTGEKTAPAIKRQNSQAAPRYALIVGINQYISPRISELSGCVNDAEDMKAVLSKYGFPESNIKVLLNEKATKQGIEDAFSSHLIASARKLKEEKKVKDALFVFYYAGHGSYTKDDNGDEGDGVDETIVPADASDTVSDLRDDRIEELIDKLSDYTQNITLVFDSCHSGTISRAKDVVPRLVEPQETRYSSTGDSEASNINGPQTRGTRSFTASLADFLPKNERYVTISGCAPMQTSGEDETVSAATKEPRANGIMTRALVDVLSDSSPSMTYRQLWERICQSIDAKNYKQDPQIEGDWDRLVFGGAASRATPHFHLTGMKGTEINVDMGSVHGLKQDAMLCLYAKDTVTLKGTIGLICQAKVTSVENFSSKAEIPSAFVPILSRHDQVKVIPATPFFGTPRLAVAIDELPSQSVSAQLSEQHRKFKSSLSRILKDDKQISISDDNSRGDIYISAKRYQDFANNPLITRAKNPPADDEVVYFLASRNGLPLFNFSTSASNGENAAEEIATALNRKLQQDGVRGLDNDISDLGRDVEVTFIRVTGFDTSRLQRTPVEKIDPADQCGPPRTKVGDMFRLGLLNKTSKNLYMTVLALGTGGNIHVVYPPKGAADYLKPNTPAKTPIMKAGEPLGTETFKIMITTGPVDFSFLTQRGVEKLRGSEEPLDRTLASLVKRVMGIGGTLRDSTIVDYPDPDAWAALRRDYVILPADTSVTTQAAGDGK